MGHPHCLAIQHKQLNRSIFYLPGDDSRLTSSVDSTGKRRGDADNVLSRDNGGGKNSNGGENGLHVERWSIYIIFIRKKKKKRNGTRRAMEHLIYTISDEGELGRNKMC